MSDLRHTDGNDRFGPETEELPGVAPGGGSGGVRTAPVAPGTGKRGSAPAIDHGVHPVRRRFGDGALIACDNLVRIYKIGRAHV